MSDLDHAARPADPPSTHPPPTAARPPEQATDGRRAGGEAEDRRRRRGPVSSGILLIGVIVGFMGGLNILLPTQDGDHKPCPKAEQVQSHLSVHATQKNQVPTVDATLDVMLTKTEPPQPDRETLAVDEYGWAAADFTECLVPHAPFAKLQSVDWANGLLTARFSLQHDTTMHAPDGSPNAQMIVADLGFGDAKLDVNLCPPEPDNQPLICRPNAATAIEITVDRHPDDDQPHTTTPFPQHVDLRDRQIAYNWSFPGPAPPLTISIHVPAVGVALGYLTSYERHTLAEWHSWQLEVAPTALAPVASTLAPLLICMFALRLRRNRIRAALLFTAFVLVVSVELHESAMSTLFGLGYWMTAIIGWMLIVAATAAKPRIVLAATMAAGASLLSALALARMPDYHTEPLAAPLAAFGAAAMIVLFTIGLISVFLIVVDVFKLRDDGDTTDYGSRYVIRILALFALGCGVAFPVGFAIALHYEGESRYTEVATWVGVHASGLAASLWQLAPLIVVTLIITEILALRRLLCAPSAALPIALMLTLAAPASDTKSLTAQLPLWAGQLLVIFLGVRGWLSSGRKVAGAADRAAWSFTPAQLLSFVREPTHVTPEPMRAHPPVGAAVDNADESVNDTTPSATLAGASLLSRGSHISRMANASAAATRAGYLAVLPVLYFAWTTLGELGESVRLGYEAVSISVAVLTETSRWIVSGFLFGYFYRALPGRVGPVKALWFAGLWTLSCLAPTALARSMGLDVSEQFIYRSAQFALFVIVLAVFIDLATIRSAGGSVRDLQKVYALQNYGQIVAAVAPALALAVTVVKELMAGSGLEVANAVLSGISAVIPSFPH
jgi:hypothetical protein